MQINNLRAIHHSISCIIRVRNQTRDVMLKDMLGDAAIIRVTSSWMSGSWISQRLMLQERQESAGKQSMKYGKSLRHSV
jgi:hypothetical protein